MDRTTEKEFWHAIWGQETQGFHEGKTNYFLAKHIDRIRPASRILVPLCGRAYDLQFLADHGHDVTGVEFVEHAARGFFEEQGLAVTERTQHQKLVLESGNIRIIVSDVLDLTPEQFGVFDVIYDRAAAVALPTATRLKYSTTMQRMIAPQGVIFLVTFVDSERTHGPPFAIDQEGVRQMYPSAHIECIDILDSTTGAHKIPEAMMQKAFWIA